ncbi:Uncharacterised protein [Ectopseudomonas oleovorans]|uniref:Uncharacterized protein n=1 Tax=Ectopseudomonas oleovorans TaxID=301 RepID=A0A379K6V5_ECTOL|nr:Uncharacterised protein [Pseudomonas oleovorans]
MAQIAAMLMNLACVRLISLCLADEIREYADSGVFTLNIYTADSLT